MFKYLRRKLGITGLESEIESLRASVPALDARNRQVLTAVESLMNTLKTPTADDSLIMFHLRSMGYCGGWKAKQSNVDQSSDQEGL